MPDIKQFVTFARLRKILIMIFIVKITRCVYEKVPLSLIFKMIGYFIVQHEQFKNIKTLIRKVVIIQLLHFIISADYF